MGSGDGCGRARRDRRTVSDGLSDQRGLTLIEMMVALVLLGFILSATASALISFSTASVSNERRVQATAFLTRLHEQLQAVPWDQAVIYESEASSLVEIGLDDSAVPTTLESEPLVLVADPDNSGCPASDPDCARQAFVPYANDVVEVDGREYELFQAVTWIPDAGSGQLAKRFTTVVRWDDRGKTVEERFESTRAATAAELGDQDLPEVLSHLVSPGIVQLDAEGRNQVDISVSVTFDRGITSASIEYPAVDEEGDPLLATLSLTPASYEDAKPFAFEGTIPASSARFLLGDHDIVFVGVDELDEITATRTISFVDASSGALPPQVFEVLVNETTVEVGKHGNLCDDLTLWARVDNADPIGGTVTANYTADTGTGASMDPMATITGSNDQFRFTWAAGSASPWEPTAPKGSKPGVDVIDHFDVIAENPDGQASSIASSENVTFRAKTTQGGNC